MLALLVPLILLPQDALAATVRDIDMRSGRLGVAVLDLRTGERWGHQADRPFPMQSVFKFPLGVAVLKTVDAGRLRLDSKIVIRRRDLSAPWSPINERFQPPSVSYTVRELLERAVGESDNTAADVLMRRIGGPAAVTRLVGVPGIRISRYESDFQMQYVGLGRFRPAWASEPNLIVAMAKVPKARRAEALKKYLADPRDTATPNGMVDLLRRLESGRLLRPTSRDLLLKIMTRTKTGPDRIRKSLPTGAVLAHKTGTGRTVDGVAGVVNDSGIVTLADGRKVAIAVFVAGRRGTIAESEAIIARVAKAALQR